MKTGVRSSEESREEIIVNGMKCHMEVTAIMGLAIMVVTECVHSPLAQHLSLVSYQVLVDIDKLVLK